ncbi:hypothetical protein RYZ26_01520 [Terasakiella sp. A23]|uniref:hypothetical protein n=1 Tax=Terasakiella sp. FCG-A23 TaxID=3080561 RepID=UPI00295434C3|nr:hypothetical protein [Terasakiella sp. A23]MDV7338255.1 hypothetical protein [Terasakiella sp. A23]
MTTIKVDLYPVSSELKHALGVSEKFDRTFLNTTVTFESKPDETTQAHPRSRELKAQAKENLGEKLRSAYQRDVYNMISTEVKRLRNLIKEKNATIWTDNNGLKIKDAIDNSATQVSKQLKDTLSIVFIKGTERAQLPSKQ